MAYRSRFAPLKADETHPFLKTDHNRGKHWARKAGNGRGMGRLVPSHPLPPTQLATRPPQSAPVGTVWKGHFVCPACRTRTDVLIRQSAASTTSWVCQTWCSPADPRREHFVSTRWSNK